MPGVSRRAYARLHGVSEGAVRKAIAAGKIPVMPDGLIDPAVADTAWLRNRDTGQQSKMAEAISAAPAQMALGPPAIVRASHEAAASAMPPEDSQPGESIVTPAPLTAARIENTQESTAFKRMLRMKAAGDLIEREEVDRTWGEQLQVFKDRLRMLSDDDDLVSALLKCKESAEIRSLLARAALAALDAMSKGIEGMVA
jgi:hypothetical protein